MQFSRVITRYVPHGTIWFDEAQMDSKDLPRSMWYQIMRLCLGHFATQNMKQRSCEQIPLMTTAILPMWELSGLSAGARPWEFYFKDMNEWSKKRNAYFCQVFFHFCIPCCFTNLSCNICYFVLCHKGRLVSQRTQSLSHLCKVTILMGFRKERGSQPGIYQANL